MKFLTEASTHVEALTEQTAKGKRVYIEGPFLMAEAVNRNGRIYSRSTMEIAVDTYVKDYVSQRRATGELNHPEYPFPDPKKAAIMIENLRWEGNNVIGKARVLNTPDGLIIQELLEAGYNMGVSTRGLGDVKKRSDGVSEVTNFSIGAIDAVDRPSGQVCYVNAVNESVDWVNRNGVWVPEKNEASRQAKKTFDGSLFLSACQEAFRVR